MRYYRVEVGDRVWTSHPAGNGAPPDLGALLAEMDIYAAPYAQPMGQGTATYVRLWGIALQDIAQARDFNGKPISVYGGMGKGLPLANPAQAGLLVKGLVQRALANWVGTQMTLDFFIMTGTTAAGSAAPQNIVVNWKKGTPLGQAIQQTLSTAFPGKKFDIKVNPNLVLNNDETGIYGTVPQFSLWVNSISRDILNNASSTSDMLGPWSSIEDVQGKYDGVDIYENGDTFAVFDGTTPGSPKALAYTDLIGQPTWLELQVIQITLVMRGDIKVGDFVTLPQTRVIQSAGVATAVDLPGTNPLTFQGTFLVKRVHHVGNYKSPDALAWVTVLDCANNVAVGAGGQAAVPVGGSPASPNLPAITP